MRLFTLLTTFLLSPAILAADRLELHTAKSEPPTDLAEDIRKALAAEAMVIKTSKETRITIWFRAELPSRANAEQVKNGLTYREMSEGTLVAVVQFHTAFTDFRKQEIPAGVYTLRIAVQPDIGDHKDTAPHSDFVLLVPAKVDRSLEDLEVKDLIKLSRKAPGGDHPGVMLLFPNFGKEAPAKLDTKDGGLTCLQLFRPVKAGGTTTKLGFALVIEGHSAKRE